MTGLATFDFDSQTSGSPVTASSPWTKTGATVMTASPAAAVHGVLGGRITAPTSLCALEWAEAQTTATRVLDFYITPHTIPGATYIAALADGATSRAGFRINDAGTVSIRNATIAVATSAIALTFGEAYRFSWRVSTSGQELRVYEGESDAPLFTLTGAVTDATHTKLIVGMTSLSSGAALDLDTIRVADDWLTPVSPATPLPTPDGFTFVASASEVRIDAAWDAVTGADHYQLGIERRDGATWVEETTLTVGGTSRLVTATDGLLPGRQYRGHVRAMPLPEA